MKITLSDLLELLGSLLIAGAIGSWNLRVGLVLLGLVLVAVGYVLPSRASTPAEGPDR